MLAGSWLGSESLMAKIAAQELERQKFMAKLAESPMAKIAAQELERQKFMAKLAESPMAKIAALSKVDAQRFVDAVGPRLTDLAGSLNTVAARLPEEVARRTALMSADMIERVVLDPEDSDDRLAAEVAAAPGYEELWDEVQAEVEALLDQSPPASEPVTAAQAASWHVSWLLGFVAINDHG